MIKASKNWFDEINYLRAIAIIAVVIIHATDDTFFLHKLNKMVFMLIYIEELSRFAVPMFIFISGFVLYNKYKSELPMRDFYMKRFSTIILPYIFFSVIYDIMMSYPTSSSVNLNSITQSIFNFDASGHLWYIKLILTFYIFFPVIIAYYDTLKKYTRVDTFIAIILSTLILYLFEWFVCQQNITNDSPLRFLIYFLLGIYVNDNYEQISKILERIALKKVIMLAIPIVILPFFTMIFWIDARCGTQFANYIPHYTQLALISEAILHIFIFVLCIHLILSYKPKSRIIQEIGEYSYGIFLIHAVFHNLLAIYILPSLSISIESLTYYVILFSVTMLASYFAVKLMLTNNVTALIITGKQHHKQI